jgi:hypothetical protein
VRAGGFSHCLRCRGVRHSGTIINASLVSQAYAQSPCANHVSPLAKQIDNLTLSSAIAARCSAPETFRTAGVAAAYFTLARSSTRVRTTGRASAWASRLSIRNAQRRNGQSIVRRTTSGAAGNRQGTSIEYLRHTTSGVAGNGLSRF